MATVAENVGASRPVDTRARFQYRLSSLLLIMTLVAILSGIIAMHRGVGVVVAILALPALVRTCITSMRRGADGRLVSSGDKVGIFALTLIMAGIAGGAAYGVFFFTNCALHLLGNRPVADPLAVMAGLVVGGLLVWLFWWLSHRKHKP